MSRILRRSLALAGLVALAAAPAACVHGQQTPADAPTEAVVGVQVINHAASPVSISLDSGAGRQPLLVLGAHGVTSFEVPIRSLAQSRIVRLSARELGNARQVARVSARVMAGQTIVWTIEPNIAFSSVSARAR
ncbi:MAG TPA: hypothetical protein VK698_27900 [Kofleriaceae bacterium]|nr:hypothetical protein [Kofleriaceae bacterium]